MSETPSSPTPECINPFDEVFAEDEVVEGTRGNGTALRNPYEANPETFLQSLSPAERAR